MKLKVILLCVVLLCVTLFAVQNTDTVELRFLVWKAALSSVLLVLILFAAGLLSGWLLSTGFRLRSKWGHRNQK